MPVWPLPLCSMCRFFSLVGHPHPPSWQQHYNKKNFINSLLFFPKLEALKSQKPPQKCVYLIAPQSKKKKILISHTSFFLPSITTDEKKIKINELFRQKNCFSPVPDPSLPSIILKPSCPMVNSSLP